jgi:hypothetical protein
MARRHPVVVAIKQHAGEEAGLVISCARVPLGDDCLPIEEVRFALDSPLERGGFELPVPREIDHGFEPSSFFISP